MKTVELGTFKAKASQLMQLLQQNDLEGALRCINEINCINNEHVHTVLGKITRDGVYLEELEHNPAQYLPDVDTSKLGGARVTSG